MKLVTTLAQSDMLVMAGVKPETADMSYMLICTPSDEDRHEEHWELSLEPYSEYPKSRKPAWTLAKLLDLIPKGDAQSFDLSVGVMSSTYRAYYSNPIFSEWHTAEDPMDAMVSLICGMLSHYQKPRDE